MGNTDRTSAGKPAIAMPESGMTGTVGGEWWEILPNVAMPWLWKCKGDGGIKADFGVTIWRVIVTITGR